MKVNPDNQILMHCFNINEPDEPLKKLTEVLLKIARDEISIKDACNEWYQTR